MTSMDVALISPPTAHGEAVWEESAGGLSLFATIPKGHGVVAIAGQVAIYDEDDLRRNELQDGAFYVVEYQSPRSGMSWQTFHADDRRRLDTSREVVRAVRCQRNPEHWWLRHARASFVSGPMLDFNLTDMIVGKVVGIYRP